MTGVIEAVAKKAGHLNNLKALQSQRIGGVDKDSIWACIQSSKYTDEPFARVFAITPDIARQLLERNDSNRAISKTKVRDYVRDMLRGSFMGLNGQTIVVAEDGSLIDGQHRLVAIIESGEPVRLMIVFGVDASAQESIDQGKRRTLADRFKMAGVVDHQVVAAVVNICQAYETGGLRGESTGVQRPRHGNARKNSARETDAALLAYGQEHMDLIRYALSVIPSRNTYRLGGRARLAAAYFLIAREIGSDSIDQFFDEIVHTKDSTNGYVPHEIRKRLIDVCKEGHVSQLAYLELVFRAWNAWAQGKRQSTFQVRGSIPKIEKRV